MLVWTKKKNSYLRSHFSRQCGVTLIYALLTVFGWCPVMVTDGASPLCTAVIQDDRKERKLGVSSTDLHAMGFIMSTVGHW